MKINKNKAKGGFTLVEIITVLFIVSLGLVGILSLIVQNIQSQSYNKNNLIAYQLAQEGVELIRKVRDSNWKAGTSFDTNLAPGQYYMDYQDDIPHPVASADDPRVLLKQDSQGLYLHHMNGGATPTNFSRLITIDNTDGTYLRVAVKVFWTDANRDYSYDLETMLYDWR